MVPRETNSSVAPTAGRPLLPAARRWFVRTLRWHALAVIAANLLLTGINIFTGGTWWAFWPLLVTGTFLAIHYFFCKAAAVNERWVAERVEELNLKSYDRGHIEELKSRYGGGDTSQRKGRREGAPDRSRPS